MYRNIRSGNILRYENVKKRFTDHQAVWPERVWNEDSYIKYIVPYLSSADAAETMTDEEKKERADRLAMLQGDKSSQRDWWLFNAFKYRDSKYGATESKNKVIIMRGYTDESHPISNQSITLKTYSNLYAMVEYASSYQVDHRMEANETHTFPNPMQQMNNTEVYVYSADRISDIGDLSPMNLGQADFSAATKLNKLIIGSSEQGYENTHLTYLSVGANQLLTELNVCNCTKLEAAIDLSPCVSIEKVLATGSIIKGVQLPVGGHLKQLELPGTVTNLTIRNQKNLTTFAMEGYTNISTLRVEYTPNVPIEAIINGADVEKLSRVRLMGMEWIASSEAELKKTIDRLDGCSGLDVNDQNVPKAVVNGKVNISVISSELLIRIQNDYPDLVVVVNGHPQFVVHYLNYDGSLLYNQVVAEGGNATDPVAGGQISAPTRPDDGDTSYTYSGWSTLPTNVHKNSNVTAQYVNAYKVKYVNDDGTVLQTSTITHGQSVQYTGTTPTKTSTAQYTYAFKEWVGADDRATGRIEQVTSPKTVTASYTSTLRSYTAKFYAADKTTVLQTSTVAYGSSASYTGTTPVDPDGAEFEGWEPASMVITGDTNFYPKFAASVVDEEIADDWATIVEKLEDGRYATAYKVGNYKTLDLGTEGTINMQTVAMDNEEGEMVFVAKELLATKKAMNSTNTNANGYPATDVMKPHLNNTIYPLIPEVVRKKIKPVSKTSYDKTTGADLTSIEKLWILSAREVYGGTSYEKSGAIYNSIYKDSNSRKKALAGASSFDIWWLRSAFSRNDASFRYVYGNGDLGNDRANGSAGVCLGFVLSSETLADSWEAISSAIGDGSYRTKYSVGDTKRLDLGDEGNILMQIAAMDTDALADGSGTAAITWVAKQLLVTSKQMNTTSTNANGYPATNVMKPYLAENGVIWNKLPAALKTMIKAVSKTSYDKTTGADLTSIEKLWIPSAREVYGGTSYEKSGPVYSDILSDSTSRKRKKFGASSFDIWWLRSAFSSSDTYFRYVNSSGSLIYYYATASSGVCLGFCT